MPACSGQQTLDKPADHHLICTALPQQPMRHTTHPRKHQNTSRGMHVTGCSFQNGPRCKAVKESVAILFNPIHDCFDAQQALLEHSPQDPSLSDTSPSAIFQQRLRRGFLYYLATIFRLHVPTCSRPIIPGWLASLMCEVSCELFTTCCCSPATSIMLYGRQSSSFRKFTQQLLSTLFR